MLYFKTTLRVGVDGKKEVLMNSEDVLRVAWMMGITDLWSGDTLLLNCIPDSVVRGLAEKIPTITEEYEPTVIELVWMGRFYDAQEKYRKAVGCTDAEAEDAVDAIWNNEGRKEEGHSIRYYDINGDGII